MSDYDGLEHIFQSLAAKEIVAPYLEKAMLDAMLDDSKWPNKYYIPIEKYQGTKSPSDSIGWYYPSTHPLEPERLLYYMIHPRYRGKLVDRWKNSLPGFWSSTMGIAAHAIIQTQLKMIGKITDKDIEVRVRSEEKRISGRIDFLYHHEGRILPVELKTQNGEAFDQTHKITPYWNSQLQICMDLAGFDEGVLLLMRMGYPWTFKEFRVQRDQKFLDQTYQKFARVLEAVKNDTPPPHCCEEGSKKMNSCPARFHCWLAGQRDS